MEIDKTTPIYISAATKVALEEFSTSTNAPDEEKVAVRANEILTDALLDPEPTTDAGKKAKAMALQIIEDQKNGIESPYVSTSKFDMNPIFDSSVTPSVGEIFEAIAKFGRSLALTGSNPSPELIKEREDALNKLTLETFSILNKNSVMLMYYQYVFKDMRDIIEQLDKMCERQVIGHTKVIISGVIGARHPNPRDNTFNSDCATYQDLLDARQKMIDEKGGVDNFFRKNFDE